MTTVPVTKHFEVKESSVGFTRIITKKDKEKPNPLPKRITELPFHKLEVGQSIWLDMDLEHPFNVNSARLASKRYNQMYDVEFDWKKHRGDARKSGFKYLEIARIR